MKKIDKLILKAFLSPFLVTTSVVLFIFLMRFILTYFDEFVGKNLGFFVFIKLFSYFTLITVPIALPLAVLLACLMTYGNLGEFFELTALKSAGISTERVLLPTAICAVLVSVFSFWFNLEVVPEMNLKAWSLMWDVKTKKATLNIKEGIFYYDIPNNAIKVQKKYPDNKTLKGLVIYNHKDNDGNKRITLADSGQMYTIMNNSFLVFELFNGNDYSEYRDRNDASFKQYKFTRSAFKHSKVVYSLASFDMNKTEEQQFSHHAIMQGLQNLQKSSDSLKLQYTDYKKNVFNTAPTYYSYHLRRIISPSLQAVTLNIKAGKWIDSLHTVGIERKPGNKKEAIEQALQQAKSNLTWAESTVNYIEDKLHAQWKTELEWHHKFTQALACFVMFLLGAPLGSIIKKGGFGIPTLVAVILFIISYVLTMNGDKWAKEGLTPVVLGAWLSNGLLFLVGMYFLNQARNDSRLFEADAYIVAWQKFKKNPSLRFFLKK